MNDATSLIVPIRDFEGMTRLTSVLEANQRSSLARTLAAAIVTAGRQAGLHVSVVTADDTVSAWVIDQGVGLIVDPGRGLSAAASEAVEHVQGPWLLAHADLPAVNASALAAVANLAKRNTVLAPSMDGGTNLIAHNGPFPFSFGEGSFHRHLAAAPDANVVASAALSIEVDTPAHLNALNASRYAPSLTEHDQPVQ